MVHQKKPNSEITHILHHLGEENTPFNAISPPIFQTSNFFFDNFADYQAALANETQNFLYTRGNNPTVNLVETKIAALEHAERAKLVASGVAAISGAILAFLKSGDHIIAVQDCYSWAKTLFTTYLGRFNIHCDFIEGTSSAEIESLIRPETKVIYLESPTTLTFKLQNLKDIANLAKNHGIRTIIDNTWATPLYQNPIDFGIDIVIHSVSKYLGGHSDVVAGVIVGSDENIRHIFKQEFLNLGYVPDPFMAWLVLRGLRTLEVRLTRHNSSAMEIAKFLSQHPKVRAVHYPFLESHPQYSLAREQMRGGAGLFSFHLDTQDLSKIKEFIDKITIFRRAVSWGGYESLIYANAISYPAQDAELIPPDRLSLIRIHIGLESPHLLIDSLTKALEFI